MLDTRRLRVLCEVARHGSFSAAATALGYTQPAISRQIATLEAEVGVTLVRRVPQGALLTDAGRLLVGRGGPILAALEDVETELRELEGLEGGTLRIASFASAAASFVPHAIARFRARHPAVELSMVMADPGESIPRLIAGELDLALSHDPLGPQAVNPRVPGERVRIDAEDRRVAGNVRAAGGNDHAVAGNGRGAGNGNGNGNGHAIPAGGYVVALNGRAAGNGRGVAADSGHRIGAIELVHLFDDPMYVAMPMAHELADAPHLELASFAHEQWMVSCARTCPDSRLFRRACNAAGFDPQIAFESDDYPAILGFVAAGVGVALIPEMASREIRSDVIVRGLEPAPPARPISAALPAGYRSPAAAAMLAVLLEVSAEWVAERSQLVPA